tara:strand:+ start:4761 stop:5075 length:315 start_codon:yes stop_codon:yes gene_type:complete
MKFKEYYKHYLKLHRNKWCRRCHILGQLATVLFIAWAITSQRWIMLLFAPFVVYPLAWCGHLFFEKNKPAAFTKVDGSRLKALLWAKAADCMMMLDILRGRIKL